MTATNSIIQELHEPHVHMKNPDEVYEKIQKMAADGKDKFLVISDFDHTLTKPSRCGHSLSGVVGVLFTPECMSKEFREAMDKALSEFPGELPTTEQTMKEVQARFYKALSSVCTEHKMSRKQLTDIATDCDVAVRDGFTEFVRMIDGAELPFLIVSAGISDILAEVLHQKSSVPANLHVVANHFKWDEEGTITGFADDQMHLYNKSEWTARYVSSCSDLGGRSNLIVVGDHLPDANIADEITLQGSKLKVGYLNSNVKEKLESYKNTFDVVLTNDDTFTVINAITRFILSK